MEEIALGCLAWKPDDFERFEVKDLIRAVNGYEEDQKARWERVRTQCTYMVLQNYDSKKNGNLKWSDVKMPIDPPEVVKPEEVIKITKLTREEVRKEYVRCGMNPSDDLLDRIFQNQN